MKNHTSVITVMVFVGSVIVTNTVHAVFLELASRGSVITTSIGYSDQVYNPLLGNGLRTTADMHISRSGTDIFGQFFQSSVSAAVYGSDFSSQSGPNSTTPFGVEPMAFTVAQAENTSAGVSAYIDVDHRVTVNPVLTSSTLPASVLNILRTVSAVEVTLKARMESQRGDIFDRFYTGFGIVGGSAANQIDIFQEFNEDDTQLLSFANDSQLNFTVEPSDTTQNLLYKVWASSNLFVSNSGGTAVVDPLLEIDPDWIISNLVGTGFDPHGANYFIVQQESVLNPGEWVEVTRDWATTVVPIPAAFWLFGSGLIGLMGIARRMKL